MIDTSVILHDLRVVQGALYVNPRPHLDAVELMIPIYVLEELEGRPVCLLLGRLIRAHLCHLALLNIRLLPLHANDHTA